MNALSRRKRSACNSSTRLDELPGDILIIILSQCRIDELFALRSTSRLMRDLIAEYIATIAPSVARSTFRLGGRVVNYPPDRSLYSIGWLRELIPRQLSSILVDRGRFSNPWAQQRFGIPAEDAFGDALRARVANGWRVLRRLTKISEDVYQLDEKTVLKSGSGLARKVVQPLRYKFDLFRHREELIVDRRLQYIKAIDVDLARDYKLMFTLLSATFRTSIANSGEGHVPWVFDWGNGIDAQRLLRRGTSWLAWYILNQGPDLFWQQWWMSPADSSGNLIRDKSIEAWFEGSNIASQAYIRDFVASEWTDVDEKVHNLQREHAAAVQRAMHDKAVSAPGDFASVNPVSYFQDYADHRLADDENGLPPVRETLGHVPFHIDFRCPPEWSRKVSSLRQDRAARTGSEARNG